MVYDIWLGPRGSHAHFMIVFSHGSINYIQIIAFIQPLRKARSVVWDH